jgi:beta-glucanase (GH16 family)
MYFMMRLFAIGALTAVALAGVAIRPMNTAIASHTSASPPGPGWRMVFHDDFNGRTLNSHAWSYCWPYIPAYACTNGQEAEFYRATNVSVSKGSLHLTAKRKNIKLPYWPLRHFSSGMVTTARHFTFQYGYAAARIQVPRGVGFWLQPVDHTWPPEIDAMEHLGIKPSVIGMAYHWKDRKGAHTYNHWLANPGRSYESGWHTYAVDWEPGKIQWYIDGKLKQTFTGNVTKKKMWLNLTFAMSADPKWGVPGTNTHFPSTVLVDYVRVWQRK